MKKNLKYDDMLVQIRQIIKIQDKRAHESKYQNFIRYENDNKKNDFNIESIIEESSKIINQNKGKDKNNLINRGKILAANELLKNEAALPPFVKNYVKEKIQSQVFSIQPSKVLTKQEIQRFQKQKQILIRSRQQQFKRQKQHRAQLVKDVKQFDQSRSVRIPVHQIDTMIFNEEPTSSYLLKITPNNKNRILSKSNQLKNSNLFISQVYQQQQAEQNKINQLKKSQIILKNDQYKDLQYDDQYKVFQQEAECYYNYQNNKSGNDDKSQQLKLAKYPNFVKIFGIFLQKQLKIIQLTNQIRNCSNIREKDFRKSKQLEEYNFLWKNKPKKFMMKQSKNNQKDQNISTIVQKFRFKPFLINEKKTQFIDKNIITEKKVNKMSGQSKIFHLKHCVLTKNEIIYYDQKNKKDIKKIQIPLQKIQIQKGSKQQGSFFSKKQQNIDIVNLKGKSRNFKYQKNSLEGEQFYNETLNLMARKIIQIISKKNGSNRLYLQNFMRNINCKNLRFSNNIFKFIQNEPSLTQRQLFLSIFCDLIPQRLQIQNIQLIKSKLLPNQINQIFYKCYVLNNLKKIDLSSTKILKQNFNELCKLVNESKNNLKFDIILKSCKLDDEVFSSNIGAFTSFCTRVKHLNISTNNLTSKTIQILKNSLQNMNSEILHLIISHNPIKQLMKISSLIKDSRKLQYLDAQNCELSLQKRSIQQIQAFFEFMKRQNSLKSLRIGFNGCISQQKIKILSGLWLNQSFRDLQVDIDFKNSKKTSNLNLEPRQNSFGQLNFQLQTIFLNLY